MQLIKNMGKLDRYLRVIAAFVIGYLYMTNGLPEAFELVFLLVAVIFVLTAAIGTCPLYFPFKMNTNEPDHRELP
jgi:hypothetical protein